jgi:hypothetical protein
MNLFLLSLCKKACADHICNKHLIKMILETTQMAYSVQQGNGDEEYVAIFKKELLLDGLIMYKMTHAKHPLNLWARYKKKHYDWMVLYGLELCRVYTTRYKKIHKCEAHLNKLKEKGFVACKMDVEIPEKGAKAYKNIPEEFEYFPMCFGDEVDHCLVRENGCILGVTSYREYYMSKLKKMKMVWPEEEPEWFERKFDLMPVLKKIKKKRKRVA